MAPNQAAVCATTYLSVDMHKIDDNLAKVTERIQQAALAAGRDPAAVSLLAVSKNHPAALLEQAYRWGQRRFGENYLQEALDKKSVLLHLRDIEWHFIGPIQSNKTRAIAENFDWVHTIDRKKIAQRLSAQRPLTLPPLQVCVQVNIDAEDSKSGVSLPELAELARLIEELPNLQLRGLMAIPAPSADLQRQQDSLHRVRDALWQLQAAGMPSLDTLSMGMSADLEAAVACGSTIVRVGTDIFGARDYAN